MALPVFLTLLKGEILDSLSSSVHIIHCRSKIGFNSRIVHPNWGGDGGFEECSRVVELLGAKGQGT